MSDAKTTQDHDTIRKWAEARGVGPRMSAKLRTATMPGVLRLDFEPADAELKPISWDKFFQKFDTEHLSFLYQDKRADGKTSRFHKFVNG